MVGDPPTSRLREHARRSRRVPFARTDVFYHNLHLAASDKHPTAECSVIQAIGKCVISRFGRVSIEQRRGKLTKNILCQPLLQAKSLQQSQMLSRQDTRS